ncbi:MAG: hypothetical protein ABSG43_20885 [Solirubrobacteraceae bacterium]
MTAGPAYSYHDNPTGGTDSDLNDFSTAQDTTYIIPTLQQVLQTKPDHEILANPWSPPAWMKSNNALGNADASERLLTFIANDLAPALGQAGLHAKTYGNDLSWDQYAAYASPRASDPNADPGLAGISWHCYFGSPTAMSQIQLTNPGLDQIVDECSPEMPGAWRADSPSFVTYSTNGLHLGGGQQRSRRRGLPQSRWLEGARHLQQLERTNLLRGAVGRQLLQPHDPGAGHDHGRLVRRRRISCGSQLWQ